MITRSENSYETDNQTGSNHGGQSPNMPVERLTSSSIVGDPVENSQGEKLGTIDNIMINLRTCTVEYAVLEFGSFLGIGGKLFAVPFKELRIDGDKRVFVLDRDREFLENLPGFDKAHWPETGHPYFEEVNQYWSL